MIYYISGGARSGKSAYAMRWALELSDQPVYLATARAWDDDFKARIARHQDDRDERWTNLEEETRPSQLELPERVVVIDCVTLWLTNLFVELKQDIELCLEFFKKEIDQLAKRNTTYIIISNELGMGLHPDTESGRKFTDLQGWANQYVAAQSEKAIFMVSGLPLTLK
ncbi:MAG: bifunctional adenosylcobinamide kinase/adenosylcobinamide-phosphate guanylyltransferase [Bacteroidota bacterium]